MDGVRAVAALDYEAEPPADVAAAYDGERDPFAATLSPRLAGRAEPRRAAVLGWSGSTRGSGRRAAGRCSGRSTGPGCCRGKRRARSPASAATPTSGGRLSGASPTWRCAAAGPGGWDRVRHAADVLGPVRPVAGGRARPAANLPRPLRRPRQQRRAPRRARPAGAGRRPFSVVSTGTWVISMAAGGAVPPPTIRPRTCWPTSTWMAVRSRPPASWAAATTRPGWAMRSASPAIQRCSPGAGGRPAGPICHRRLRAARAALELARRTDRALARIAAEGPILIEGRFAADDAFVAALAGCAGPTRLSQRHRRRRRRRALRLASPDRALGGALERIQPGAPIGPSS